jgi:hypothetical protein
MKAPRKSDNSESRTPETAPGPLAERILSSREAIRSLERRAYSGIHILSAFILLSIVATLDLSFLPSFPSAIRKGMGAAPSAGFISIALAVYVFSASTLSLSRMMEGSDKTGGLTHLGYLGVFFFFYYACGDLDTHFWAVLAGGATILILESYQRWLYCREEIQKEREMLAGMERRLQQE